MQTHLGSCQGPGKGLAGAGSRGPAAPRPRTVPHPARPLPAPSAAARPLQGAGDDGERGATAKRAGAASRAAGRKKERSPSRAGHAEPALGARPPAGAGAGAVSLGPLPGADAAEADAAGLWLWPEASRLAALAAGGNGREPAPAAVPAPASVPTAVPPALSPPPSPGRTVSVVGLGEAGVRALERISGPGGGGGAGGELRGARLWVLGDDAVLRRASPQASGRRIPADAAAEGLAPPAAPGRAPTAAQALAAEIADGGDGLLMMVLHGGSTGQLGMAVALAEASRRAGRPCVALMTRPVQLPQMSARPGPAQRRKLAEAAALEKSLRRLGVLVAAVEQGALWAAQRARQGDAPGGGGGAPEGPPADAASASASTSGPASSSAPSGLTLDSFEGATTEALVQGLRAIAAVSHGRLVTGDEEEKGEKGRAAGGAAGEPGASLAAADAARSQLWRHMAMGGGAAAIGHAEVPLAPPPAAAGAAAGALHGPAGAAEAAALSPFAREATAGGAAALCVLTARGPLPQAALDAAGGRLQQLLPSTAPLMVFAFAQPSLAAGAIAATVLVAPVAAAAEDAAVAQEAERLLAQRPLPPDPPPPPPARGGAARGELGEGVGPLDLSSLEDDDDDAYSDDGEPLRPPPGAAPPTATGASPAAAAPAPAPVPWDLFQFFRRRPAQRATGGVVSRVARVLESQRGEEETRPMLQAVLGDGSRYEGGWGTGGPEGKGRQTMPTGEVYDGFFLAGLRSGWGESRDPGGSTYRGWWANDTLEGEGELKAPDGELYKGAFSAGLRHGKGTLYAADGSKWAEEWDHGERLRRTRLR